MKASWQWPTEVTFKNLLAGDFYIYHLVNYSVVRDRKKGWNAVRIDFEPEVTTDVRETVMQNYLAAAEIKYHQLKEQNDRALQNTNSYRLRDVLGLQGVHPFQDDDRGVHT